jgi:membrane fusion protein (multidrug efflux system)
MADTTDTQPDTPPAKNGERRRKLLTGIAVTVIVIAVVLGLWYVIVGRNRVTTDNAYVGADSAQVTPMVAGQVLQVAVADTQTVKRGDLLLRIDDRDARIALAQAEADLARARRQFGQTEATSTALSAQLEARAADITRARAELVAAQANYDKARIDLDRRRKLAPNGAVSGEEVTSATNAFAAAQATLAQAQAGLAQAGATRGAAAGNLAANDALIKGTTVTSNPEVLAAQAAVDKARLDLDRTIIRAPLDGVVTRRQVQVGQRIAAGTAVMTIVPLNQLYVDANFKEGQLGKVRAGQPVTLTSDLYGGGVVYHGTVVGFSGGTGASFALIPAQNATGNWIKVVQRLPVRVKLDPRELAEHPLRVGLSMDAEVDISGD